MVRKDQTIWSIALIFLFIGIVFIKNSVQHSRWGSKAFFSPETFLETLRESMAMSFGMAVIYLIYILMCNKRFVKKSDPDEEGGNN